MLTSLLFACYFLLHIETAWSAGASDTIALLKTNTGGLHFETSRADKARTESFDSELSRGENDKKPTHDTASELKFEAKKPSHRDAYVVTGLVRLLFDNTTEKFTLFYDDKNKRSRIDYGDDGKVRTLQLGGHVNKLYRIEFPHGFDKPTCIEIRNAKEKPVQLQQAFPLLDKFDFAGSEQFGSHLANRWQREFTSHKGNTKHTFSLLVDKKTEKPLRLDVVARDSQSTFVTDRYEIEYTVVHWTHPTLDVFKVPSEVSCRSIDGTEVEDANDWTKNLRQRPTRESEHQHEHHDKEKRPSSDIDIERLFMNPLASLIDPDEHLRFEVEMEKLFEAFRKHHNKKYSSTEELKMRRVSFCHNFRYVNLMNRAGRSYRLKINHFADRTNDELRRLLGTKRTTVSHGHVFDHKQHNIRGVKEIPSEIDWRLLGAVTPVLDQRDCGSDWAIAATSVVESNLFLRLNRLIKLSSQELIDCSSEEGNRDCKSGEDFRAFEYIMKHGLSSESSYGPLHSQKNECRRHKSTAAKIKNWIKVPSNDEYELKRAIAMNGPIAVAMDASHKSFFFYANGIYKEENCHKQPKDANHAVVIVGYGQLNGRSYFIAKNSFSRHWGLDGYMLIESSMNQCGILNSPMFVTSE